MTTAHLDQGPNRWRRPMWAAIAALLLLPLLLMQVTSEVRWDAADFVAAAGLLIGVGVGIEITFRLTPRWKTRTLVAALLVFMVLLVWAEAAVQIF